MRLLIQIYYIKIMKKHPKMYPSHFRFRDFRSIFVSYIYYGLQTIKPYYHVRQREQEKRDCGKESVRRKPVRAYTARQPQVRNRHTGKPCRLRTIQRKPDIIRFGRLHGAVSVPVAFLPRRRTRHRYTYRHHSDSTKLAHSQPTGGERHNK